LHQPFWLLALGFALAQSPPVLAESPPVPAEEAAADPAWTKAFSEYTEEMDSGQKARAADALVAIIEDEGRTKYHADAYGLLSDVLEQLDLPYAALVAGCKALDLIAETKETGRTPPDAARLIRLADRVGDTAILEPVFAKNISAADDPELRSRIVYLAGREIFRQGEYGLTLALMKMVDKDSSVYADGKMLEAIVLNQQERYTDALAPLLVARATADAAKGGGDARSQRFKDMVTINLARTFYGAKNYPRAIEYYAQVSRGSNLWPTAQFERAWAHFSLDDMNGTLGILHSNISPFLDDHYFAEAELLRNYALFLLCKFPDATKQVERFTGRYKAVYSETKAAVTPLDATAMFDQTTDFIENEDLAGFPLMILAPWAQEARFLASLNAVRQAEDEAARLKAVAANPFAAAATRWVEERHASIKASEGARVRDRVTFQVEEMGALLANAEISKLDMLQMETRLYEMASVAGTQLAKKGQAERKRRVRRNHQYWPWEGEYWADELGYYRVTAKTDCPVGLRPAGGKQ